MHDIGVIQCCFCQREVERILDICISPEMGCRLEHGITHLTPIKMTELPTAFDQDIRQTLLTICSDRPNTISAFVAQEATEHNDPASYLSDIVCYGCISGISGIVGPLIYYRDTHAFFDKHYDEIEDLRQDWEDEIGQPITIDGDLKNTLVWFAVEQVAYAVMTEIGAEY